MTQTFMMQTGDRDPEVHADITLLGKHNIPVSYNDTFGLDIVKMNDHLKIPDGMSIEAYLTATYSRKVADATKRLLSPRYKKIEWDCRPCIPGIVINKIDGEWRLSHIDSGQSMGRYRLLKHAKECAAELAELDVDWTTSLTNLYTFPDFEKAGDIVRSHGNRT